MTEHIITKWKIQNIADVKTFNDLIEGAKITPLERNILKYIYLDDQNLNYIADLLGYSAKTIGRYHAAALKKIQKLIK